MKVLGVCVLLSVKGRYSGVGRMAEQERAHTTLGEELSSSPSTHIRWLTTRWTRRSNTLSWIH